MTARHRRLAPALLIPLAVSALLGLVGGSAFLWADLARAWNIFIAAFLWTLISAAGTTIGRYSFERLRRGEWRRGLEIAFVQSVPLTTLFLAAAALASANPLVILGLAPVPYLCTLVVALACAGLGVLTSPYRANP